MASGAAGATGGKSSPGAKGAAERIMVVTVVVVVASVTVPSVSCSKVATSEWTCSTVTFSWTPCAVSMLKRLRSNGALATTNACGSFSERAAHVAKMRCLPAPGARRRAARMSKMATSNRGRSATSATAARSEGITRKSAMNASAFVTCSSTSMLAPPNVFRETAHSSSQPSKSVSWGSDGNPSWEH